MNQPTLTLYRYRLARTKSGRLFVYGYDRATAEVRIVELGEFDEELLQGVAVDGVRVALDGHFALDMDAGAFWMRFVAEHDLGIFVDATPTPARA